MGERRNIGKRQTVLWSMEENVRVTGRTICKSMRFVDLLRGGGGAEY